MQVFINKSLRNILQIWWPKRISNKELWRQTGQRPIEEEIRQKSLKFDGPHAEETRWTCSQEGIRVEPIEEAKERKTPAHLETHKNGRVGREASFVE